MIEKIKIITIGLIKIIGFIISLNIVQLIGINIGNRLLRNDKILLLIREYIMDERII